MIDICDFAVGLSRQLYGLTIATERPGHRMMETWHPLGVVGVISAFNFPVAVWAWNACLAFVCGDSVVWKPSEKTPLCAAAVADLVRARGRAVRRRAGGAARSRAGRARGRARRWPTIRACRSSRRPARRGWAGRWARASRRASAAALLELGGNNAMIVAPSADLDLAERAIAFAAMGTAGQRCTTLRRLIVHEEVYDRLVPRLKAIWSSASGRRSARAGHAGRAADRRGGGRRRCRRRSPRRGRRAARSMAASRLDGCYVRPALVEMPAQSAVMRDGNLRADPLRAALPRPRRGDRAAERRAAGPRLVDLHHRPARGRDLPLRRGLRLRHRQRQYRPVGRRDRRRVRRREGDGRRPRERLGQLARLYAPRHQHDQLQPRPAARPGRRLLHLGPEPRGDRS